MVTINKHNKILDINQQYYGEYKNINDNALGTMNAIQYFGAFIQNHLYTFYMKVNKNETLIKIYNKVKNNKKI